MLRHFFYSLCFVLFVTTQSNAKDIFTSTSMQGVTIGQLIKETGHFKCSNSDCIVSLKYSEMGGFLVLYLDNLKRKEATQVINDVTGIVWASEDILVYSVSPIYGKPGLYAYNCKTKKTKTIVKAKNVDTAYPSGSDYFELHGLTTDNKVKIYFYYAPDVDSIDFNKFRTPDFLFTVNIDGGGFGKAKGLRLEELRGRP